MGKTISDKLNVVVGATVGGALSGLKRVNAGIGGLRSSVASVSSFVSGKFLALGAVIGAGIGVHALKQTAESIDQIAKTADRVGFTAEALIGLNHAANLGGSSTEEVGTALDTMNKQLGLAANGSAKAAMGFNLLGLDASRLAQLHPEHRISAISDALAATTDETTRTAAATKIFGSAGINLINVLSSGSAALAASREEAERLGLSFSRIDAAKVEAANDAMSRLQGVVTGVAQTLVIQLSPYVEAATTALVQMATSGEGIGPKIGGAIQSIVVGLTYLGDVWGYVKGGVYGFQGAALAAISGVLSGIQSITDGVAWLFEKLGADGWSEGIKSFSGDLANLQAGLDQVAGEELLSMDEAFGEGSKNRAAVKEFFNSINSNAETAAKAIADAAPKAPVVEYSKAMLDAVTAAAPDVGKKVGKEISDSIKAPEVATENSLVRFRSAEAFASRDRTWFERMTGGITKQTELLGGIQNELEEQTSLMESEDDVADITV